MTKKADHAFRTAGFFITILAPFRQQESALSYSQYIHILQWLICPVFDFHDYSTEIAEICHPHFLVTLLQVTRSALPLVP
jgi:hypothetical protein